MVTASGPRSANSRSAASQSRSRKSATSVSERTLGMGTRRIARKELRDDAFYSINLQSKLLGRTPMDENLRLNPYLAGNFAPVRSEDDFTVTVVGEMPPGLRGALFRIGPNPQYEPRDAK